MTVYVNPDASYTLPGTLPLDLYRGLPRHRGSGHQIERWLYEQAVQTKYQAAVAQLDVLILDIKRR